MKLVGTRAQLTCFLFLLKSELYYLQIQYNV